MRNPVELAHFAWTRHLSLVATNPEVNAGPGQMAPGKISLITHELRVSILGLEESSYRTRY